MAGEKAKPIAGSPDFQPALRELRELAALEDVNFAQFLDDFAKTGLPLLTVDHVTADAAGNSVLTYKVSDQLKVRLAAVRAG